MNFKGDHLTEREERILKCIRDSIAERGKPLRSEKLAASLACRAQHPWCTTSTRWNSLVSSAAPRETVTGGVLP